MINSKVIQTLKSLNIPIYWIDYDGNESEYIIFKTNNQDDIKHHDDTADAEQIEIGLIYWFTGYEGVSKINEIKVLMNENGFIKLNEKDMKDEEYFGRSFRFKYIKSL